jgi:16S rRNA (guanine527-N7)-methyltransferase
MSSRDLQDRLLRRAKSAGLVLRPELLAGLQQYYQLLAKWNAKVNLTAFTLPPGGDDQAIDRLLLEPVAAAAHLSPSATSLLDAGSGGGSPAIPLKLAVPRLSMRMVEVKTRKAVFLREAVRELRLQDTHVETMRFEELLSRPDLHESTDVVSIRAVRIEPKVLNTLQAFLRPGGVVYLFRGPGGSDVSDTVAPPLRWSATYPLLDALKSRLVVLEKVRIG